MADETPKPRRRRRRWLIAGVLLFVVGAAGWWNWPRGDARFVGRWAVSRSGIGQHVDESTFYSNGLMLATHVASKRTRWVSWRVDGQSLLVGNEHISVDSFLDRWSDVIHDWTGHYLVTPGLSFEIRRIEPDRIEYSGYGELIELTRIPE